MKNWVETSDCDSGVEETEKKRHEKQFEITNINGWKKNSFYFLKSRAMNLMPIFNENIREAVAAAFYKYK